jgi:hypothetical protein
MDRLPSSGSPTVVNQTVQILAQFCRKSIRWVRARPQGTAIQDWPCAGQCSTYSIPAAAAVPTSRVPTGRATDSKHAPQTARRSMTVGDRICSTTVTSEAAGTSRPPGPARSAHHCSNGCGHLDCDQSDAKNCPKDLCYQYTKKTDHQKHLVHVEMFMLGLHLQIPTD